MNSDPHKVFSEQFLRRMTLILECKPASGTVLTDMVFHAFQTPSDEKEALLTELGERVHSVHVPQVKVRDACKTHKSARATLSALLSLTQ